MPKEDSSSPDNSFVPLPGAQSSSGRKRKRRRRRPLYRRPLVVVPVALLLIVVAAVGAVGYRVESLMTSVHSVSTPPPEITDGTYYEADDPEMPQRPITVDTGPAQEALDTAPNADGSQQADDGGFTSRLQRAVSNSSDLVGGAAVAAGLKDGGEAPLTLLMMGVDARPGSPIDIGVRPDVLMVVRLDPETRSCRILSIPRDTRVELPGYGESKINHALMVGGIPYQLLVTEAFLDLEIDHYVLIDFVAFQHLVDSVGGISVDVPEDLSKNGEVQFEKGMQHLNGEQALLYTRYRAAPEGDLGRVERQWALMSGVADAIEGRDLVGDVNKMVPSLEAHLRTDLTATGMTQIARDYGSRCTSSSTRSSDMIDMIDGMRIRFEDPILEQSLYYNVVTEEKVHERVDFLINGGAGEPADGPATPVPATPGPVTASPAATDQRRDKR
jgi:LCP family protein required for cell wall assembly